MSQEQKLTLIEAARAATIRALDSIDSAVRQARDGVPVDLVDTGVVLNLQQAINNLREAINHVEHFGKAKEDTEER